MTTVPYTAILAIFIPWLCGLLISYIFSRRGTNYLTLIGQGYILGTLLLVWIIKAWDAADLRLEFPPMAATLFAISIMLFLNTLRDRPHNTSTHELLTSKKHSELKIWKICTLVILLTAIFLHMMYLAQELVLRPTFPWDAWRGWEPKSIQFFDNGALNFQVPTIGNYGEISNLTHLWMMLAVNKSHEPTLHIPWLTAYFSVAALIYGSLRTHSSQTISTIGCYMVISLPLLNTHVALAGYADLWVCLTFTAGIIALSQFRRDSSWKQLALVLLIILACLQTKRAGAGFATLLLAILIFEVVIQRNRFVKSSITILALAGAALIFFILFKEVAFELSLPGGRRLIISTNGLRISNLLSYRFNYEWQHNALLQSTLIFSSWHLTFYMWCSATLANIAQRNWDLLRSPENLGITGGLAIIIFYFTSIAPDAAEDHTGLSRSLLYISPLMVYYFMRTFSSPNSHLTGKFLKPKPVFTTSQADAENQKLL